jgi:hypothetical protein
LRDSALPFPNSPLQDSLSSPAKAGDPVIAGISILVNAAEYWMPAFAGMTTEALRCPGMTELKTLHFGP